MEIQYAPNQIPERLTVKIPAPVRDPKVEISYALKCTDGSQARLARLLRIKRAAVNAWLRDGRTHLPPLQAYRFLRAFGLMKYVNS